MRIFPCVRYEIVVEVKARFKPKKYIFTTKPENKVSDAKNKKQFDIPEAAEIYLREKLSDYIEEANIQKYYELGIVYERLLADSEKEPWIVPNLTAINKLILNKSAYVQQLIRLLLMIIVYIKPLLIRLKRPVYMLLVELLYLMMFIMLKIILKIVLILLVGLQLIVGMFGIIMLSLLKRL